jgi:hypothetical protein
MADLTPEERQRIYEDEKARIEAQQTASIKQVKKKQTGCGLMVLGLLVIGAIGFLFALPSILAYLGKGAARPAATVARPMTQEVGTFKIERFWEETVGQYTCSYTIVSYRNTTQRTFTKNVTIQATVYDSQKNVVDTGERSFFAFEVGPIGPGFEGTVKIPIDCAKGQASSVSVKIESAR